MHSELCILHSYLTAKSKFKISEKENLSVWGGAIVRSARKAELPRRGKGRARSFSVPLSVPLPAPLSVSLSFSLSVPLSVPLSLSLSAFLGF